MAVDQTGVRISELTETTAANNTDHLILETAEGTRKIKKQNLVPDVTDLDTKISRIKTYVASDGKLHFVDSTGADSVLPFNNNKYGLPLIPELTSNTSDGTITGSNIVAMGVTTVSNIWKAFGNDPFREDVKGVGFNQNGYAQYDFKKEVKVKNICFKAWKGGGSPGNANYSISISNDGSNWETVNTGYITDINSFIINFTEPKTFRYVRFTITSTVFQENGGCGFDNFQCFS